MQSTRNEANMRANNRPVPLPSRDDPFWDQRHRYIGTAYQRVERGTLVAHEQSNDFNNHLSPPTYGSRSQAMPGQSRESPGAQFRKPFGNTAHNNTPPSQGSEFERMRDMDQFQEVHGPFGYWSESSSGNESLKEPGTPPNPFANLEYQAEILVGSRGAGDFDDDGEDETGGIALTLSPTITENLARFEQNRATATSSAQSKSSCESATSATSIGYIGSYPISTLRIQEANIRRAIPGQRYLLNGDVVLISDVPVHSVLGANLVRLEVTNGRKCEGFRQLPPGIHLIYGYTNGANPCKKGFWIVSQKSATGEPGECHVLHWSRFINESDEQLVKCEKMFQQKDLAKVYDDCFPYSRESFDAAGDYSKDKLATDTLHKEQLWNDLTFTIKGSMLNRILGKNSWNGWKVNSCTDSVQHTDAGQMIFSNPGSRLCDPASLERPTVFGGAPELKFAFSRRDINTLRHALTVLDVVDSTAYVRILVAEKCGEFHNAEDLIGEMQFAYVSGTFLLNENCIEQFMFIVRILLRARAWSLEEPVVYAKFLRALNAVLKHNEVHKQTEESLYAYDTAFRLEMKEMLIEFKSYLTNKLLEKGARCRPEYIELSKSFEKLESWVLTNWDWDLRASEMTVAEKKSAFGEGESSDDESTFGEYEMDGAPIEPSLKERFKNFFRRGSSSIKQWRPFPKELKDPHANFRSRSNDLPKKSNYYQVQ